MGIVLDKLRFFVDDFLDNTVCDLFKVFLDNHTDISLQYYTIWLNTFVLFIYQRETLSKEDLQTKGEFCVKSTHIQSPGQVYIGLKSHLGKFILV